MDVVDAYTRLGSYRSAGEVCGVDPKTVKRKVLAHQAGLLDDERAERAPVAKNTDPARVLAPTSSVSSSRWANQPRRSSETVLRPG